MGDDLGTAKRNYINIIIIDPFEGSFLLLKRYGKSAIEWKADHPKLAAKLNELATEEMGHMKQLHGEAMRLIDDYRATKGEPPKEMLAIYNYEHKKQINRAAIIRQLIEDFKM